MNFYTVQILISTPELGLERENHINFHAFLFVAFMWVQEFSHMFLGKKILYYYQTTVLDPYEIL